MNIKRFPILLAALLAPMLVSANLPKSLRNFPDSCDPQRIGERLAYHFVVGKHMLHAGKWISYPETFTWRGALLYADKAKDSKLEGLLEDKFHYLFGSEKKLLPIMNHVDLNMFGCLPLTFYHITGKKKYLDLGLPYANTQWQCPADAKPEQKSWAEKGYSWQTRLWIDDMYMITIVQTQAYRVTHDPVYINRAAKEMALYLDKLQRPNGLFYHAPDVPFYWARGNGWMAAGMAELLQELPEDSPYHERIMQGYHKMMESLRHYQLPSGMWSQLIDKSDCWPETSGTAMFTYAFIQGVKHGWLDEKTYAPLARKAWIAMVSYINENNDVREICVGTNKKNDERYYYDRPRHTGDYHGQAPYLWCAAALMK